MTNIPTKLEVRETSTGAEVVADNFEQKEVSPGKFEFVTLEFEVEPGGSCSGYTTTKVKGDVAAETVDSGVLHFPSPELKENTLEAFGAKAKLTGEDKQAVVKAFTETVAQGWAVRTVK